MSYAYRLLNDNSITEVPSSIEHLDVAAAVVLRNNALNTITKGVGKMARVT